MPKWTKEYYSSLEERFNKITEGLADRIDGVINGTVTPAINDIPIGSARKMRAAVLFFDIRNFTSRTSSAEMPKLKETLIMLDCVIPMVMHIIFDNDGYIEKNTGDGVMAVIGLEEEDESAANKALSAATTIFYTLNNTINPFLKKLGIKEIDARIGIDLGTLLVARIGAHKGTSQQDRSFLTVIGPSANLASKIQNEAGTNEIWVGDLICKNAEEYRKDFFVDVTPKDWTWSYVGTSESYNIWDYNASRKHPSK